MPFAKGKNEMQASIDDTASALIQLTNEIDYYYNQKVADLDSQLEIIRKDNPNEEPEILSCMESPIIGTKWIYDEMYIDTLEMLVCKVYSFVEKHLAELLKRVPISKRTAKNRYKGKGMSDVEKFYASLYDKFKYSRQGVSDIWKDYERMHTIRNDVVHRYYHERANITANFILSNIEQAKELLQYVEECTRAHQNQ